jgi:replication factor C subunit 1
MSNTIKPILSAKKTFDGKKNALVVSEIDSASGDHGFISSLVECIKESKIPIICICDDRYCQNIKPVLNYCFDIKMLRPSFDEVYPLIYEVVINEKIKIGKSKVDKLYAQSNGDIRYILNTLQMGIHKMDTRKNIQSSNIFDTTGTLFKMDNSLDNKWNTYWMAHDIHGLMVHENYISNSIGTEVRKLENIAYSMDSLSDMDVFDSVFNYELEPYIAFQTIRATTKCNKKGNIKFPQFLGRISTMNKNKREKKDYTNASFTTK